MSDRGISSSLNGAPIASAPLVHIVRGFKGADYSRARPGNEGVKMKFYRFLALIRIGHAGGVQDAAGHRYERQERAGGQIAGFDLFRRSFKQQ